MQENSILCFLSKYLWLSPTLFAFGQMPLRRVSFQKVQNIVSIFFISFDFQPSKLDALQSHAHKDENSKLLVETVAVRIVVIFSWMCLILTFNIYPVNWPSCSIPVCPSKVDVARQSCQLNTAKCHLPTLTWTDSRNTAQVNFLSLQFLEF